MKRMMPPAACKAGNMKSSAESIDVPKSAKKRMIPVAIPVAFSEIAMRLARLKRGQNVANGGLYWADVA